jgi:hypothetical protein
MPLLFLKEDPSRESSRKILKRKNLLENRIFHLISFYIRPKFVGQFPCVHRWTNLRHAPPIPPDGYWSRKRTIISITVNYQDKLPSECLQQCEHLLGAVLGTTPNCWEYWSHQIDLTHPKQLRYVSFLKVHFLRNVTKNRTQNTCQQILLKQ